MGAAATAHKPRTLTPGPHPELAAAGAFESGDFSGSRYRRANGGEVGRLLDDELLLAREGLSKESRGYFAKATCRDLASLPHLDVRGTPSPITLMSHSLQHFCQSG